MSLSEIVQASAQEALSSESGGEANEETKSNGHEAMEDMSIEKI